ncbi:PLL family lectin [Streptomyces sp. BYX5S]
MNGDWLVRARDGRLCAYEYATAGDAVVCRLERGPDEPWSAGRTVGGEQRLLRGLALAQGPHDYVHLVSWRPTVPGEAGLVHSTHFQPHLAALDWAPIGHPNKTGDRTGPPAVAVDAQGRAHVFVRNRGGGLSMRAQGEKGGWGAWTDLKGSGVRGEPAAVTGESGLVEVYALTVDGLVRWKQREPGAKPEQDGAPLPVGARESSLTALATSATRSTLFFTDEDEVLHVLRGDARPVPLLKAAGPGPVAAVRCVLDGHDCTVLAQRTASGRVALAAYPTEQESAGAWWADSGPRLPDDAQVALVLDHRGDVVAATVSPSTGQLLVARRKDEPGLALTAWQPV